MKKFNGLTYNHLRPKYGSGLKESNTLLAKSLPELHKPLPLVNSNIDVPDTASLIKLDVVRKLEMPFTGKGFCAIVIDTGVFEHQLLQGKVVASYSVNGNNLDTNDLHGHGTHMAGIIAARKNDYSCMSIAPDAKIISIKVTNRKSGSTTWANIYKALELALEIVQNPDKIPEGLKVGVINLSFNGLDHNTTKKHHSQHKITKMIMKLSAAGIPLVVSSGNGFEYLKQDGVGYPAYLPGVIPVGATINFPLVNLPIKSLATYSQRFEAESPFGIFEPFIKKEVHEEIIYAPGTCSISLANSNGPHKFTTASGTSVSSAIVSGCVLLLQEKSLKTRGRTLSVEEVKELLSEGSERFRNSPLQNAAGVAFNDLSIYFDRKFYDGLNILNSLNTLN